LEFFDHGDFLPKCSFPDLSAGFLAAFGYFADKLATSEGPKLTTSPNTFADSGFVRFAHKNVLYAELGIKDIFCSAGLCRVTGAVPQNH
jgi:hypothetical protein